MFERFTDRARMVLVFAQKESRQLGHSVIGTEHLLLGLMADGEGIAGRSLRDMGVSADAIRADIADARPSAGTRPESPPFTPRAKKVLELSLRESLQLGTNYIGGEHLLLGIIREGGGLAVQALVDAGVDLGRLRNTVMSHMAGDTPGTASYRAGDVPVRASQGVLHSADIGGHPVAGPRCPYCSRRLENGGVAYKVLKVPRTDAEERPDVADIAFVYCTRCGKVIAHAPFSDQNVDDGTQEGSD